FVFFFQAEDGIRVFHVTGVQTCALPILVRCEDDLRALYSACAEIDGCQLMLQEHIPGGSGKDWFFHGYCDAASTCEPAFTGVKERSYPARAGLTCLGRCEEHDELLQQLTALLKSMSYQDRKSVV